MVASISLSTCWKLSGHLLVAAPMERTARPSAAALPLDPCSYSLRMRTMGPMPKMKPHRLRSPCCTSSSGTSLTSSWPPMKALTTSRKLRAGRLVMPHQPAVTFIVPPPMKASWGRISWPPRQRRSSTW